jgi:RHS repeat-associated protein
MDGITIDVDIEFESLVDRYYDPSTGQFVSVDPELMETGQPYEFAGGDPMNATDPLGSGPTCGGQEGACEQSSPGHAEVVDAAPPPPVDQQNYMTEAFVHANPNSYEPDAESYNSAAPPGADRQTYDQYFVQSYEGTLVTVPVATSAAEVVTEVLTWISNQASNVQLGADAASALGAPGEGLSAVAGTVATMADCLKFDTDPNSQDGQGNLTQCYADVVGMSATEGQADAENLSRGLDLIQWIFHHIG